MDEYVVILCTSTHCYFCMEMKRNGVFNMIKMAIEESGFKVVCFVENPPLDLYPLFISFIFGSPTVMVMPLQIFELGLNGAISNQEVASFTHLLNAKYNHELKIFEHDIKYHNFRVDNIMEFINDSIALLKKPKSIAIPTNSLLITAEKNKPYPQYPYND